MFQEVDNMVASPRDVIDDAQTDKTVASVQYEISSYGADYDVDGLVKRLDRNDIFIPDFQRSYIWTQREASRFIESLLLGLPVPGVFLARDKESKKLFVIDGQQRLKTLQFFYNGFFNPKPSEKLKKVFRLINVQKQFEGITYAKLTENDRIMLNDTIIHATIVKQESPKDDDTSIYHIFERLNTSGRKLTPQQIRVAIYHGKLINKIRDLNQYQNWRYIFGSESTSLKDQELILRFLALLFEGHNYQRPMNEFMNKFTQINREPSDKFLEEADLIFKKTIDSIYISIGAKAFRPERAINAAVFDSIMVGLANQIKRGDNIDNAKFKIAYNKLLIDKTFIDAVSQSTSDDKNVAFRLQYVENKFSHIS